MCYRGDTGFGNIKSLYRCIRWTKEWMGKATSERATEQGGLGDHSSDPDGDGTRGNDNQEEDENNHRSGIGNVAEAFTGQKNPDELGDLLDCLDDDRDPDDC